MANRDIGTNIPTTYQLDPQIIATADFNAETFKHFLVLISQAINELAYATNLKDSGFYSTQEYVCGQMYFPDPTLNSATTNQPIQRQVYRKVVNFGALPSIAGIPKSVAHNIAGINANTKFTRIYGAATNPAAFTGIAIPNGYTPYAISIWADATNVYIAAATDLSAFTNTFAVIEFIR